MADIIGLALYALLIVLITFVLAATTYLLLSPLLSEKAVQVKPATKGLFLAALIYPLAVTAFGISYFENSRDAGVFPFLILNWFVYLVVCAVAWQYRKAFMPNYITSVVNLLGASFNGLLLVAAVYP